MATLKDVAQLANVNVSTVSRALNNTSYVHPDTKAKILAAVEKLSYQPNLLAKSLRQGKRHTIGVIVPRLHLTVFSSIAQAIEMEARKLGYTTILCSTEDDIKTEKDCLNRLRNGLVDGIIIAPSGSTNRLLRDIQATGLSIIQIIRYPEPSLPSVIVDYTKCSYDSTKFLIGKGCKRIGLITGSLKITPYKKRYEGYKKALREFNLPEVTAHDLDFTNSLEYGYSCTKQLLAQEPQLDAILAAVDAQGIGAIRALKEAGKQIPKDVKIMSLTGHEIGNMLETTMTSMEMPAFEIGKKAAQILIEDIENNVVNKSKAPQLIYESTLCEREST